MKKTLACAALVSALGIGSLPALDLSMVSFDAKLGYESEYVAHGRKEGQENVQLAVELGADVGGGHLYGGATSVVLFKDTLVKDDSGVSFPTPSYSWSSTNVSPYVGYTFGVGELGKADVGYTAHVYTNLRNYNPPVGVGVRRNTNEVYGGVRLDVLFDPRIYAFYDFEREELAFVGGGSYSWDLSPLGLANISLEAKATLGYDYTKRPYGGKFFAVSAPAFNDDSKDYFYYCFEGVVAYRYNDNVIFKGRASCSGNSASEGSWTNAIFGGKHKNCVWLGGSVEVRF
ncbi:MAG: hypothetical protein LBB26_00650 [Puniceicoccales bacterium]|jgi:hypothetical protein|nr:hypothetical protein [Puniceicoccales bacterium]